MLSLLQIGTSCNNGAPGTIAEQIGLLAQKNGWMCYTAHGSRYRKTSQLNSITITSAFQQNLTLRWVLTLNCRCWVRNSCRTR